MKILDKRGEHDLDSNFLRVLPDDTSVKILENTFKDFGEVRNLVYKDYQLNIWFRNNVISIYVQEPNDVINKFCKIIRNSKLGDINIETNGNRVITSIKFNLENVKITLTFTSDVSNINISTLN